MWRTQGLPKTRMPRKTLLCWRECRQALGAVVQWQNFCFPSRQRGFDSRQPLHRSLTRRHQVLQPSVERRDPALSRPRTSRVSARGRHARFVDASAPRDVARELIVVGGRREGIAPAEALWHRRARHHDCARPPAERSCRSRDPGCLEVVRRPRPLVDRTPCPRRDLSRRGSSPRRGRPASRHTRTTRGSPLPPRSARVRRGRLEGRRR